MICKKCAKEIKCPIHGDGDFIDTAVHDMDDSRYYWCNKCVDEGATICSIFHWCGDTLFQDFTDSIVNDGSENNTEVKQ